MPGSPVSRAESGQVQLATASPKAENSLQAHPLEGIGSLTARIVPTEIYIVVSHCREQLHNGAAQSGLDLCYGLATFNYGEAKLFLHLLGFNIHLVFEITETFERLL